MQMSVCGLLFEKEIATTWFVTMFCLWEEYEIKTKSKEKFTGRIFYIPLPVKGNFKKDFVERR